MKENIYTVGQVNSYIGRLIKEDFLLSRIQVKGEVSNCKNHYSGHTYFTLKDSFGVISCVMFAGNKKNLDFELKNGDAVIVSGEIRVYEKTGSYQLYAQRIRKQGEGELALAFMETKKQLEEMGMFDAAYKQEIPKYAKRIGIVTAPTGAAVRDIIHVSKRRNPGVQLVLYPAIVQGDAAVPSICKGIQLLDTMDLDVIIVGRGGGSIEDLWAFNTEDVARAIFCCHTPVISAVGHETDTTIADYVADLRAPTPSAAAEMANFDRSELERIIAAYRQKLNSRMQMALSYEKMHYVQARQKLISLDPAAKVMAYNEKKKQLSVRLSNAWEKNLQINKNKMQLYAAKLDGLSPAKRLAGGYSFVEDKMQHPVTDAAQVETDDFLTVHLQKGSLSVRVEERFLEDTHE